MKQSPRLQSRHGGLDPAVAELRPIFSAEFIAQETAKPGEEYKHAWGASPAPYPWEVGLYVAGPGGTFHADPSATAPTTPSGRCELQGSGRLNQRGTARRRSPSPGGSGDDGAAAFPTAARTSSTPTGHGIPIARFLHSRAKPAMGTTIAGSPRSPGTARKGATRRRVPAAADADDAEVEAPRPRTRGATSTPWA